MSRYIKYRDDDEKKNTPITKNISNDTRRHDALQSVLAYTALLFFSKTMRKKTRYLCARIYAENENVFSTKKNYTRVCVCSLIEAWQRYKLEHRFLYFSFPLYTIRSC